ncbi:hypothetical protein Leryth_015368 [Lithospermum erythrorhizon]|nr:hypothetical protein Leryth_015368 [Lithospermum erythrorhizon]
MESATITEDGNKLECIPDSQHFIAKVVVLQFELRCWCITAAYCKMDDKGILGCNTKWFVNKHFKLDDKES